MCNELIEETARHRKLIFGMWESFGYYKQANRACNNNNNKMDIKLNKSIII